MAQQVRRLEADLGFQLFHRKARGLALTTAGRDYHAPVRRALAIIDDATRKLRPESTRIAVSVTPSFASKWLVPRLHRFTAAHPDIDVQTIASEWLADFRFDGVNVAIRQGHPPFGEGLGVRRLAALDLRAVCSPGFADTAAPIGRIGDFAAHPLIQDSHHHWDRLFKNVGIKAQRRILQLNQTALAPRLFLDAELAQGRLVELWQDRRTDQAGFFVVWPEAAKPKPARHTVVDWIVSEVGRSEG